MHARRRLRASPSRHVRQNVALMCQRAHDSSRNEPTFVPSRGAPYLCSPGSAASRTAKLRAGTDEPSLVTGRAAYLGGNDRAGVGRNLARASLRVEGPSGAMSARC